MEKRYQKKQLLGKGATAEVFLVEEIATGQQYAMKVCKNHKLLEWEAKLLKKVNGGIFPALKEYSEKNKEYLVMEYIAGSSLQELLDKGNQLEPDEIVYIMDELLKGVEQLHLQSPCIIYRDLKPANIMVDKNGRIRLVDLGAACYEEVAPDEIDKETRAVIKAGTYGYAAPEQFWEGVRPDKTCDIYGAGKVFAYLLTGKNPAEPPYDMEHFCKSLKGIEPEFMEIVERSLAVNPQARYEECEKMRREIHKAFEAVSKKKWLKRRKKTAHTYEKCIWKSEYRRIF